MKRALKIISVLVKAFWQSHSAYRLGAIIWIVNGFVTPLILMSIWLLIRQHQQLAFDEGQIITYYLLMIIMVRLTQSWSAQDLSQDIKDGKFSQVMLRPLSFTLPYIAKDMALRAVRLVSMLPFLIAGLWWFWPSIRLSTEWWMWAVGIMAICLGYVINLLLELMMGLASFWLEQGYGLVQLIYLLSQVLNGSVMPLALLPLFWQQTALVLPFRYLISFPIEVLMGRLSVAEVEVGFALLGMWMAVLFVSYTALFRAGVKKYTAIGS